MRPCSGQARRNCGRAFERNSWQSLHAPAMNGAISRGGESPSPFAQSRVRSSARVNRSNNSSISGGDMTSGGQSDKMSPASERTIRPSASAKRDAACTDAAASARTTACVRLSATSSMPPISPMPRASPTSGCSPSARSRCLELRRHRRDLVDDPFARIDLERLERDRGRDRMARIGEAVAEGADLAAFVEHRLVHPLRHHDARRSADRPTTAPWRPRRCRAGSRAPRSRTCGRAGRSRRSPRRRSCRRRASRSTPMIFSK